MNIKIKRIYDESEKSDGRRILVDRLWPRGIKKQEAHIDDWLKDIAPSDSLRKWFRHDPEKWGEFKKKYYKEISTKKELLHELLGKKSGNITLVYSAKDKDHNNAAALKEYLENKL